MQTSAKVHRIEKWKFKYEKILKGKEHIGKVKFCSKCFDIISTNSIDDKLMIKFNS